METASVHREREIKLAAPPGVPLPDLTGVAAGAEVRAEEPRRLVTVHWDTADLRILRWGCALRHRSGEGWTVKLPDTGHDALLIREEHTFPGRPTAPPVAALELLTAYVRGAMVTPLLRMVTMRRPVQLRDTEGRVLVEVDDDEVSVFRGRRLAARFREVEVELLEGGEELLDPIVERLRSREGITLDPTPKLVRALGGWGPPTPELAVPGPDADATLATAITAALAASVTRLLRHDAPVRLDAGPEAVHQARVATRRLRSDLRTLRPVLDAGVTAGLRDELRWLGGELGAVRDAEVLAGRIAAVAELLPAADRDGSLRVTSQLATEVGAARERLLTTLRSPRYVVLLEDLVRAARIPPLIADGAAAEMLPALVAPAWSRLRRDARRLRRDSPADEQLHALRIRAKRCRYAAELAAPVMGRRARILASRVADLQEVLGAHHDDIVAAAWLREHAGTGPDAHVAGELGGLLLASARDAGRRWPAVWKRLTGRSLSSWL